MSNKTRVLVIFGGRSGEHEVSLNSARSILAVLDPDRYEIIQVGITHAGIWLTGENVLAALDLGKTAELTRVTLLPYPGNKTLYAIRGQSLEALAEVDVVFPVLHGTFGEDGTIQGLLELADLPYVGAGVLGSSVGMDKALFKDVMRMVLVPVLPSLVVNRRQIEQDLPGIIAQAEKTSAYPIFTKPANLGSSVGVTKCHTRSDLMEGLMDAARYDRRILIERGLEKPREIEISVLGNDAPIVSLPGEILPGDDFYTYQAKYLNENSELIIPARLSPQQVSQVQEIALRAYQAIDCSGMARIDFLLDRPSGELYVSEINTIPGFTRISMYPKLWAASGVPYPELIDRLISLALERKVDRDATERQYGSAR
jgi:D-alanine-D-alanine ligase